MARSNMLTCTGLITYTSETKSPEGALVVADNVNVDEPNVITPRRGLNDYKDELVPGDETARAKQLLTYKGKVLRHFNDKLEYEGDNAFIEFDGSYSELETGLRIKGKEQNGNFYITTSDGIQKISAASADDFTPNAGFIVKAGVQKATDLSSTVVPTTGGFLPQQSKVAYRGLFGYKDANNTIPLGSPSSRLVVTNVAKDINIAEESSIVVTGTTFTAGQYILLYSTNSSYVLWFDTTGSSNPPATAETVGKTLVKISLSGYTGSTAIIASKIAQDILAAISDFDISVVSSTVSIKTKSPGSTTDIALGSGFTSNATVATSVQGQVVSASSANVQISAIIPNLVTTNYFFQLYRTAVFEVSEGLTLDDVQPDDEMQLVYETPVTAADIANGEITVLDVTPEIFRAAGTPLYTNPNTGDTIAQSNEVPPVAKDIEPFKNCMFYANTKYFHQTSLTVVSVDDFVSNSTQFYVGDSSGIDAYTFIGEQEITELEVAETSRTVGSSYVNLYSASNVNKYYLWFDKGSFDLNFNSTTDVDDVLDRITLPSHGLETGDLVVASGTLPGGLTSGNEYYVIRIDANTIQLESTFGGGAINLTDVVGTGTLSHTSIDPAVSGKIGIRVDLTLYPDTVQGTRDAIKDALIGISDFSAEDSITANIVIITNAYNGNANDFTLSSPSPGPLWDIATTQQGDGESVRGSFSALSVTNPVQVTAEDHNLKVGDSVKLTADSLIAINGTYTVSSVVDKDTFEVAYDNSAGSTDTGKYVEASNHVLLSSLASVSQSIDETTRSLVKQINLNSESNINAFYLSGAEDLPGSVLLQRKDLNDIPFYLAISNANLSGEFNPELPALKTVSTVTFSAGANSPAKITTAIAHGLSTGTNIYISSPDTVPAFAGEYKITVTSSTEFTVPVNITTEDLSGAECFYYLNTVKSDNLIKPNRLYYSKYNLPEAVPTLNYLDIGNKDKQILRILALRDNLFVMKEDGVYLIFGDSFNGFRERLLDRNTAVSAPDTAVTLNNQIYALADQGVVAISDSGAAIMSRLIENKFKDVTNPRYDFKFTSFGVPYETDRSYLIWLPTRTTDTVATQCYRLNTVEQTWTRWTVSAVCGLVNETDDKLYIGAGDRNYIMQERKNADRSDYADRSFARSIVASGYNSTSLSMILSSVADIEVGDVIYQSQTVTIAIYNRLLRKLDLDTGLNDNDYESSLLASYGDNIATKLNQLNAKLYADIGSPIDNARVFTNNFTTMRTLYNDLIDELNDSLASTQLKNYKKLETEEDYPTPYEAIVELVNKSNNTIGISTPSAFIEGDITVFKGIKSVIQWAPMHYGDPMAYKQVSNATCIFDQNNFYSGTMAFSSDLSPSFKEVLFYGKGLGDWGASTWGDLDLYWGGQGNDAPYRDIVPVDKQRCRYHNIRFSHVNAREYFRILGITASVRAYSDKAYRGIRG